MARESKIILCKGIKLDKDYNNTLNYNESQLLNLCNTHKIAEYNDVSFVKGSNNTLFLEVSYNTAIYANYIAFQNPRYSNKWFFAFVDSVEYLSDSAVNIKYTLDVWSTWWSNWTAKECFVLREHVADDTIGLHTLPENVEHGPYVHKAFGKYGLSDGPSDVCVVIASTIDFFKWTEEEAKYPVSTVVNGIFSGTRYFAFRNKEDNPSKRDSAGYFLQASAYHGMTDSIQSVFTVPKSLINYSNISWDSPQTQLQTEFYKEITSNACHHFDDMVVSKNYNSFGGYTPKNNKLFCYPYNFFSINNSAGTIAEYHYEDFSTDICHFRVRGVVNPGCDIYAYPLNYKGVSESQNEIITAPKFPICNYINDSYTNWETQNSININGKNIPLRTAKAVTGSALSLAQGDLLSATASIGVSVVDSVFEKYEHSFMSPQVQGDTSNGNIKLSNGGNDYWIYNVCIKAEYAKIVDEFFTKFGYQVNTIKVPNLQGRPVFNYVQIASSEQICYGDVPSEYMQVINNIARRGTTIWKNHDNIGNYELNNK